MRITADPSAMGTIVLVCTFGAALAGIGLRSLLPEHHFSDESKQAIKVGVGLIATMTALILGLVTASAKDSFDQLNGAVKHTATDVLSLDRTLARYGPETAEIRAALKLSVAQRIQRIWHLDGSDRAPFDPATAGQGAELLAAQIRRLAPQTEEQRGLQSRALELAESLLAARWTVFAGLGSSIPGLFLAVLTAWLTITFASFGLFAPRNATVITVFFLCALSVAGAVFLVLEMDEPFEGMITIPAAPMQYAVSRLNQ